MKTLNEIANECRTDKGTAFNECHGYAFFYESYFRKFENPKILEIGSWQGASTKMFNEFYNGQCDIWTYDIDYSNYKYLYNEQNVHCFKGDQNSRRDWEEFFKLAPNEFDLIIDDGSHRPEHQLHTLIWLYSHVAENGLYVLEDLHTYMWDELKSSPLFFLNFWNDDNKYVSQAEKKDLFEHLDDITIWHRKNDLTNYCRRSITSILTFKK